MGINQTERTEIRLLPLQNRPKYGFFQDRTDRTMGFKQTETLLLTGPSRTKHTKTDQYMYNKQNEHTKARVLPGPNKTRYEF